MAPTTARKFTQQQRAEILSLIDERIKEHYVTRSDFKVLQKAITDLAITVKDLAEAQKRTEQSIKELTERQNKTEQSIKELTEAQKRTEQSIKELTERQNKTEQSIKELTEAQKRTEQRVDSLTIKMEELTVALKETQIELRQLAEDHRTTRRILGDLTHTIGYTLEDTIMKYIPDYAFKEYGVTITTVDRRYITYPDKRYDEINIYSEGTKNGNKVYIIGESKAQLGKKDVESFDKMIKRLQNTLEGEIIGFVVCYSCTPDVEEYVKQEYPYIRIHKSFDFYKYKKSYD
ncbi:MAG: hypothetical protein GYA16_05885 [Spirochaetes bacterium]|nr:hypothetical protein [Spirochaetota bacterium]